MGQLNWFCCEFNLFFSSLFGAGTEFHLAHVTEMFESEDLGLVAFKGNGFSVKKVVNKLVPLITAHGVVFGLRACYGKCQ